MVPAFITIFPDRLHSSCGSFIVGLPWSIGIHIFLGGTHSMKLIYSFLFVASMGPVWSQAAQVGPGPGQRGSGVCGPGALSYDDGTYETGYGWNNFITDGVITQRYVPPTSPFQINQVCASLTQLGTDGSWSGNIHVYADSGSGPGALLASVPFTAVGVATYPSFSDHSFDLSASNLVVSGNFYLGLQWNASVEVDFFIGADESPSTPLNPGYAIFDDTLQGGGGTWVPNQTYWSGYRALAISVAVGSPVDVPALGPWGLVGLVAVLMVGGLFLMRRRRALT